MKKTKQEQIAVIYARARGASRAQEDQAIQAQIRACHQWAESHGYTIAKTYIDRGKGASRNLQEREGLYHLLRDTIHKRALMSFSFKSLIVCFEMPSNSSSFARSSSGSTCN